MGLVAQRQGLAGGADVDLMNTHNVAHAQRGNADFLLCPLAFPGTAAVLHGVGPDLLHCPEEHMGGAAGGVHLPIVVNFQDFNIRLREGCGGLGSQAAQHRNAQAHIAAEKHGDFPGGIMNQLLFFLRMAGGADDSGAVLCQGVAKHVCHSAMVGEIDDHFRLHVRQLGKVLAGTVFPIHTDLSHRGFSQGGTDQLSHSAIGTADNRSHTFTPCLRISAKSFARFSGSMGVSGRRICSSP